MYDARRVGEEEGGEGDGCRVMIVVGFQKLGGGLDWGIESGFEHCAGVSWGWYLVSAHVLLPDEKQA